MIATVSLPLLYLIFRHVLGPSLTSRTCVTRDDELVMLRHEVAMLRRANSNPARTGRNGPCSPPRQASKTTQASGACVPISPRRCQRRG
jgi:hypothetical protein